MERKTKQMFIKEVPDPDDRPIGPNGHPKPGYRTAREQRVIDQESQRRGQHNYPKGMSDDKQKHIARSNGC